MSQVGGGQVWWRETTWSFYKITALDSLFCFCGNRLVCSIFLGHQKTKEWWLKAQNPMCEILFSRCDILQGGGRVWKATTIDTFSPLFSEWCSCRSSSAGHDWVSHSSSLAYSSESPTAEPPGQDFQASENETSDFQFLKHNFGFSAHSAGTAFHEWRRSNGDSSFPLHTAYAYCTQPTV